jgi:hypothetical protein
VIPSLLSVYDPKDIFNVDECGLFLNSLLDKTHALKVKAAMGAREVKIELLFLYVQIWMGLKRCRDSQRSQACEVPAM